MEDLQTKLDYALSLVEELNFFYSLEFINYDISMAKKIPKFLTKLPERFSKKITFDIDI